MSLTAYVVDWALGLKYEELPKAVLAQAREHILDGYGLALSGFDEESHAILRRQIARAGGLGEATVLGTPLLAPTETGALGIAAPLGGGYRENFGTMTKPLHAGQAAQADVLAARLARDGFTAATNILEAKRGFFSAAAGGYEPARIDGKLGNPFFFTDPGISIKPYPCGSLSHPGFDAVLGLVREYDVRPEEVVEAVSGTNSAMTNALIYALPQTALEAKFSFPFFLAISILRRKAGLAEFKDEVVRSPEVQEMMKRCRQVVDPEIESQGFQHMETLITIKLRDGRVVTRREMAASGHPLKPMSKAQLEAKFCECADLAVARANSARAAKLIWELESVANVADLHHLLTGTGY